MTSATTVTMTVPARFRGPARSGNGGWSAGRLAEQLMSRVGPATVQVRLSRPPPLDVALDVELTDEAATARHDGEVVATATRVTGEAADLGVVESVTPDVARAAEESYAGHDFHPFPGCFACGIDRATGDGLRIFPGQVDDDAGQARVAATWTPDASVADDEGDGEATIAATWAALDCIGGWAGDLNERLMVLGTMTAVVGLPPRIDEEHVVVGGARGREGRRTLTASALYDPSGRAIAVAEHVWIAVPRGDLG